MSLPRYAKYKESGVEWLGEVPEHWVVRRIGAHFKERREKVSDADFPALSVTRNGIVPQLETAAKSDDGDNRKKVCAGDFVINSRSDRRGSSGESPLDGSVSLINTVLHPSSDVISRFTHHLFRSYPFQEEYYRFGKGIVADLWSTNYSEMRNINIALPSVLEQSLIAEFIDHETAKIDTLVEEQRRLIELLKEKRQAVISNAVTKGLDPNVPMKSSGVEWLGDVPEHWNIRKVSSVSTKITNGFVGPTRDLYVDEGIRYLQSMHIKGGRIVADNAYFVSPQWSNSHSKSILETGDVLTVQTGDVGQSAVVTEEFAGCNCHALIIVSPQRAILEGEWLSLVMASDYGFQTLLSIQTGALHPHLNCGDVKDVYCPLPSLDEQREIIDWLRCRRNESEQLILTVELLIGLLKERRSALISAAVTGKIDVRSLAKEFAA